MSNKYFDVIVAKEYVVKNNGKDEKRTAWNKIGRAWPSHTGESLSFELFLHPNQRYVIQLKQKDNSSNAKTAEDAPF
jgi:hypothetical protein